MRETVTLSSFRVRVRDAELKRGDQVQLTVSGCVTDVQEYDTSATHGERTRSTTIMIDGLLGADRVTPYVPSRPVRILTACRALAHPTRWVAGAGGQAKTGHSAAGGCARHAGTSTDADGGFTTTHRIGEAAKADGVRISVLAYDDSLGFDKSMYIDGYRMIGVQVQVTNSGSGMPVGRPKAPTFWLGDGTDVKDDYARPSSVTGVCELDNIRLSRGQSAIGWMVRLVPPDAPTPASVTLRVGASEETHRWILEEW